MYLQQSSSTKSITPVFQGKDVSLHAVEHYVSMSGNKPRITNYEILNWNTFEIATLLYDPKADKVALVLKPEPAPLGHGESPWVLSPVSTYPKQNEHYATAPRRATKEQTGFTMGVCGPVEYLYMGPATLGTKTKLCLGEISLSEKKAAASEPGLICTYSPRKVWKLLETNREPMNASAHALLSWFLLNHEKLCNGWKPSVPPLSSKKWERPLTFNDAGNVLEEKRIYEGKHAIDEIRFNVRNPKDGEWSEAKKEVFDWKSQAVFVLPYDPEADKVALIEEFKPAPTATGDRPFGDSPFILSTIAGSLKPDESPTQAAVRETREETGIKIGADNLRYFGSIYPNPSVLGTKSNLFVAKASFSQSKNGGIFGDNSQNEQTRLRLFSPDKALGLMECGKTVDSENNYQILNFSTHGVSYALMLRFMLSRSALKL